MMLATEYNEKSPITAMYPNLTVSDLIDTVFSHNEIIALCSPVFDESGTEAWSKTVWKGHAHELPEEYKKLKFYRIFGCIQESIDHSDTIYIKCDATNLEDK